MKRMLVLAIAIATLTLGLALSASATATLGLYNNCHADSQCLDITLTHPVNATTGVFAYMLTSKDFSEFYAGPSYKPSANSEVLLGIGTEQGQGSCRFGGWSDIALNKTYLEYDYEFGGSGYWYKVKGLYAITPNLQLGIVNKTEDNTGLEAVWQITPEYKVVADVYHEETTLGATASIW